MSRLEHAKLFVAASLIALILEVLGRTYRFRVVHGADNLDRLVAGGQPAVIAFWHEAQFLLAYYLRKALVRRGIRLSGMSSHSRDGELGAKLARMLGIEIVRGSSSRGGTRGLRDLYRTVARNKCSPLLTPDGPRGPAYEFKTGGVVLAQVADVPIVSFSVAADRCWRIGSWDRMIIPNPFSRITIVVGEPFAVPRGLDQDEMERHRLEIEQRMRDQLQQAKEAGAMRNDE
jgi:lysophospholipid acyltransferase (LPLAT)-like uncharacterized protein